MKKNKAKREIQKHYDLFWEGSFNALSFNMNFEDSLTYLKLENKIASVSYSLDLELSETDDDEGKSYFKRQIEKIDKYPEIITPMVLVYLTSVFEIYIKGVIKVLLKFNPSPLDSSEKKVPLQTILSCTSLDHLLDVILNDVTHELGYNSISDQIEYLNKKINLNLSFKRLTGLVANRRFINLSEIQEIFLIRNLILHNGGVVNKQYLSLTNKCGFKEGNKIEMTKEDIDNYFWILSNGASAISRQSNLYIKNYR
ncbi:MAG: hypothetical protein EP338_00155 [Bacteroidetes bacterium]|nr:MAG: hypothetical protein EP338_00155 [Bacteroidota bacterium]